VQQTANVSSPRTRVVVVGGGFGGANVVRHLENLCRRRHDVDVTLVSRDNYFLMTPFLFEACSGTLELTHCSVPIRAFLRKTRFVEATVRSVDLERRVVHASGSERSAYELAYDHLVLAPGSVTNRARIPGSEQAFTFKALADALALRNHLIERFERADVESDSARKRKLLSVVVVGGGLVGVELLGELTAFADAIVRFYPNVAREEVRFFLLEAGPHIMPEIVRPLARYAERVLSRRSGLLIRTGTRVKSLDPEAVHLADETIEAATIVLSAGILPNPLLEALPVEKGHHGEIVVDATMRCPTRPELWALGDCASIPGPEGKPYPTLAQHALREARALASNLHAAISGGTPRPFVYHTEGMMGSLGHKKGFAQVLGIGLRGIFAWWIRRTYYLLQMPGWGRRLHIFLDWTAALLFRPEIVKLDTEREVGSLRREAATGGLPDAS
jgi:NADH:ubiquinone reductase (H+-translocating)